MSNKLAFSSQSLKSEQQTFLASEIYRFKKISAYPSIYHLSIVYLQYRSSFNWESIRKYLHQRVDLELLLVVREGKLMLNESSLFYLRWLRFRANRETQLQISKQIILKIQYVSQPLTGLGIFKHLYVHWGRADVQRICIDYISQGL